MDSSQDKNRISAGNAGKKETTGVKTLLGDPKKAIVKLSIPMIVAMSVQTIYSLIDTYWVSGLGADALAAMGFVFPFFFISMALSNGIGIGGGAAISRRIGAHDKKGADNAAVHTIIITVLVSIAFTIPFYLFAPQLFTLTGAGKTTGLAVAFAQVIFLGSIVVFFSNVANAILRSEGDSKRAMQAMLVSAVLNIIIDPIFIYNLNMGIAGAAWATLLSIAISSLMMGNWLFFRKDTYVTFNFKNFHFEKSIVKEIFEVTVPASAQQLSMSLSMIFLNSIIVLVSNTDGVAVYATGWRIATIAMAPLIGMSTAIISITGAAIGARDYIKAKTALSYSTKLGFLIECVIGAFLFVFATQIALVFTQSEGGTHITADLARFLKVMCLFYPIASLGFFSSSFFQGAGKGMNSLIATLLRTIVFTPVFAALLAFTFNMGQEGAWWGMVIGNGIGSLLMYIWAEYFLRALLRTGPVSRVDGVSA
ncbi:MAG TPA: MATE family efflux transporter [Methanosarcina sp.]|nr:MATE family efflux transporter [Methanosarcina sp.]